MLYIDDFFDEATQNVESSFREQGLEISDRTLRSIAVGWCINTEDNGPQYYRVTLDNHAGRKLLELFSKLADIEEEEMVDESENRRRN